MMPGSTVLFQSGFGEMPADGGAVDPEMARLILDDVAGLARLAVQEGHEVYCRMA